MKRKFSRYMVVLLAVLLMSVMVAAGCNGCNPPDEVIVTKDIVTPLTDLVDLGVNLTDYAPTGTVIYDNTNKANAIADLKAKQDSEKEKHNYAFDTVSGEYTTNFDYGTGEYNWKFMDGEEEEDTTTFTKIFLFSDTTLLVERMAAAHLSQDMMLKLVAYICRADATGSGYNFVNGTGSAIQDYEELDELYDIYDEDDSDANYLNLQKKRRKVMHEVFGIFENNAAAASRTVIEMLSYAQEVVNDEMIPDFAEKTNTDEVSFREFFTDYDKLFDYDTLVYFLSFNQSSGAPETGGYLLETLDYNVRGDNRKTMMTLYGYYYQYEKREFDLFTDTEYFRYLDLGLLDYFNTNEEALEYRDFDRKHYEKAYRYSAAFYKLYYQAHFGFQLKQEKFDINVYELQLSSKRYATQMQLGCDTGLEGTLKMGDVNYEYTGVDKNVTDYNNAAKAYYSISEANRENEEYMPAKIALVNLEVQQLKSQHYTIMHDSILAADLTNALKYQIYSFSGDYLRTIASNRKDDTIYNVELANLTSGTDEYADKVEEIGRNDAMYENHDYFYNQKGNVDFQLTAASGYPWKTEIASGIKTTMETDYQAYHDLHKVYGGTSGVYVDEYFEDTLFPKIIENEGAGNQKKTYDTTKQISRLADNHENVFRYAYGKINVEYREPTEIGDYTLNSDYVSDTNEVPSFENQLDVNPDTLATLFPGVIVVSGSEAAKFIERPDGYNKSNYKEETYDSDENIRLAIFDQNTGSWKGVLPKNGTDYTVIYTVYTKPEGNITYTYLVVFEGWYIDVNLQYLAEFDHDEYGEEFSYDIRLYAGYKVIKINTQA